MPPSRRARALAALAVWVMTIAGVRAQQVEISVAEGRLQVKVDRLDLLRGMLLEQLRDGRSVRVDFRLSVLDRAGGASLAGAEKRVSISFDLWEEQFAVATLDQPRQSISHLRAPEAEAWCVALLAIPVSRLGRVTGQQPVWIKLEAEVPGNRTSSAPSDSGFSLGALIDRLSRRGSDPVMSRIVEAGPFRLPLQ